MLRLLIRVLQIEELLRIHPSQFGWRNDDPELFGAGFAATIGQGRNWFDTFDYIATNWMLPLGGLGIALFTAWRVDDAIRHKAFLEGTNLAATSVT